MIKLLRVDHRLIHGQVAFAWTSYLGADCILVANDEVVNNSLHMTTLKLAKPANVKLVVKNIDDSIQAINSGVTDKYILFIVVSNIKDAQRLSKGCSKIKQVNLGGVKARENTRQISSAVSVTDEEIDMIRDMINFGIEVEIRQTPTQKKVLAQQLV
ncbi:PTS sugar transporter subunit IIB [Anaerocolumna sp. MB42-C2]|uniref:PTS sugar transporter subunit IIB n=1 Tax=Anaerocolumna sp. MB42-C2 TaxID=3070997 RepID=UPI0027E05999|nr:PTS sugar transporter subunit IIB [Anaerocolumna sp. MB42-C2]WMJ89143.1 PTS sugar transporter subunit IIB [Anaerocolumna sp. MB42-C2]